MKVYLQFRVGVFLFAVLFVALAATAAPRAAAVDPEPCREHTLSKNPTRRVRVFKKKLILKRLVKDLRIKERVLSTGKS